MSKIKSASVPFLGVLLAMLLMMAGGEVVRGQTRNYATQVSKQNHVDAANDATDIDITNFATLKSYGGIAAGIGSYFGEIELQFSTSLAANKTSYVRIDFDSDILNSLLGGSLGSLLASVGGTVILGNHTFTIEARNGSTTVLTGNSTSSLTDPALRLIKDVNGHFYLAITPPAAYDRIYIKDATNALLLGTKNSMKVYNAFYVTGTNPCGTTQEFATGYEGTGLTLDLLGLGKAGVTNPENVIDANQTNYSTISLGILGVDASISQNIYFETLSNFGDDLNIKIQVDSALLNIGLLNNISVTAYNGTTEVFTQNLATNLNIDLLGLLKTGQATSIPISIPSDKQFDRVKVTMASLLNVNLTQSLKLYSIIRSAGRPTFTTPTSNSVTICSGTNASLKATTTSQDELRWYDAITGGSVLETVEYNKAFTTPILTANKTYYVAARKINCPQESERVPVTVTVNPLPTATISGTTSVCQLLTAPTITFIGENGTAPYTFIYKINGGSNLTITTISGNSATITATTADPGIYTYDLVNVKDAKCEQDLTGKSIVITVTKKPTPPNLTVTSNNN